MHEIVRLLKSSKAYDVKNGTALDQCQQGAMSCQKPFKQIETIEIFFKQTKIIKAKIKCAPKNFTLYWIQNSPQLKNFVNVK